MTLTLYKLRRVVVPQPWRDRFGLAPGQSLGVVVEADGFRLRPVHPASVLTHREGLVICTSEVPAAAWDIPDLLEREHEQRSRQLGGI